MESIERDVHEEVDSLSFGCFISRVCIWQSGEYNKNLIENIDETHFVINMDNGKTLGFRGDQVVKYGDVVSSGKAMTMVIRIIGGVHAQIMPSMRIFTNALRSYSI